MLIFTLVAIVAMSSCNPEDVLPQKENLEIGVEYGGGTVGHIYDDGTILIVSDVLVDENGNNKFIWGTMGLEIGTKDRGYGRPNTDKIIAMETSTENFAAKMCVEYRGGGFDDWYLPAQFEADRLYQNMRISEIWTSWERSYTMGLLSSPEHRNLDYRSQKDRKNLVRAVRRVN